MSCWNERGETGEVEEAGQQPVVECETRCCCLLVAMKEGANNGRQIVELVVLGQGSDGFGNQEERG